MKQSVIIIVPYAFLYITGSTWPSRNTRGWRKNWK